MATNTLTDRGSGQTITDAFFNDIHNSLKGDFVGRDSSGVPASGKNLGNVAFPWGSVYANSIIVNGQAVDASQITSPQNRVTSGQTRSTSNQPQFIEPNGAAASFVVAGATTPLVVDISGATVSVSSDLTESSLSLAPSSNNTCLVNDSDFSDEEHTRIAGEDGPTVLKTEITVDTMGSEISSLVGTRQAFLKDSEVFTAIVESSTSLAHCFRGLAYNSSLAPLNRDTLADNDTITLLQTHYIFLDADGTTVDTTTNEPFYSFTAPSGPATGDYWFDQGNEVWKRYDGADFQIVSRVFLGWAFCDSTNCIAARSREFFANYSEENSISFEKTSTEIMSSKNNSSIFAIAGKRFLFESSYPNWNITTDLDISADMIDATEQSSRIYYLYMSDEGETIVSDIAPYRRDDLRGNYHPHNPYRCFGWVFNDSSSDFTWFFHTSKVSKTTTVVAQHDAGQSFTNNITAILDYEDVKEDEFDLITTGGSWNAQIPVRCKISFTASATFAGLTVNTGRVNSFSEFDDISSAQSFTSIGNFTLATGQVTGSHEDVAGPYLKTGSQLQISFSQSNGGTRSLATAGSANIFQLQLTDYECIA